MNHALKTFCTSVRGNPSTALEALLKIAETKDAMSRWRNETAKGEMQCGHDIDPLLIAIENAFTQVDMAEEIILDAFQLSSSSKL